MKNQSILYISYYFPPIHSIASVRNYHLVKNWISKVDKFKVLTTTNQEIFPKDDKSLYGIDIKKISTLDYRTISFFIKRDKSQIHFDESAKSNTLVKFLIKLNETLPFSLVFGEGGMIFILSSVWNALRFFDRKQSSVLVTPYRPAANVIAGYLTKLIRKKICWVISMHDIPINYNQPNCFFPRFQKKIWKHLLSKADRVITLSSGLASDLKSYGVDANVVENGMPLRLPQSAANHKFLISFTGSLYDGIIEPTDFFKSIERLIESKKLDSEKVSIIYAGKDSLKWKSYCSNMVGVSSVNACLGILTHLEALDLQTKANLNLLLTWNSDQVKGILTGKLFEYIGARNPILALVKGSHDRDLDLIFSRFRCGEVVYSSDPDREEMIDNFIVSKYEAWLSGQYAAHYNPREPVVLQSWELQADKFWNFIIQ